MGALARLAKKSYVCSSASCAGALVEKAIGHPRSHFLVLLRMILFIFGPTKRPFGKYVLFFWGFLSKSKILLLRGQGMSLLREQLASQVGVTSVVSLEWLSLRVRFHAPETVRHINTANHDAVPRVANNPFGRCKGNFRTILPRWWM